MDACLVGIMGVKTKEPSDDRATHGIRRARQEQVGS